MAEMVNQRKKHFAEEKAKAKRNKPMTQSQLRIYMSNYLKNQGTWKLSQLKKLKFEEIKEEFDKLVQQIDTFVPINLKATKAKLKRYGEELQTKTSKKQKIDDKDVLAIGEKSCEDYVMNPPLNCRCYLELTLQQKMLVGDDFEKQAGIKESDEVNIAVGHSF
ncbi:hypothetical protein Tco_0051231 [Tanacetum coccineum]